jgi:hypothetical protein
MLTAFYDANVLYPAELRNLLMHLAVTGLFRAKWYEELIPSLRLPDPNDRHVLAAAIHGQAYVIVTMNLRDFPGDVVRAFHIEAQHPDQFILHLLDQAPDLVMAASESHRKSLKNPPRAIDEYWAMLE